MNEYSTLLETYTLSDIIEFNDLSDEDALEYMVEQGYLNLPDIKPLDFD